MPVKKTLLRGKKLADAITACAIDRKADRVTHIHLSESMGIADWFVVCEGDNPAHNRAIADEIACGMKERGATPWHSEGLTDGRWVLLDFSDVVVHVMLPELNEYYNLAELGDKSVVAYDGRSEDHD